MKLKHILSLKDFINENYSRSSSSSKTVYADFSIGGDMDDANGNENPDYLEFTLTGELEYVIDYNTSDYYSEDSEYDYSVDNIEIDNESNYTPAEIARINDWILENIEDVKETLSNQ